MARTHVVVDGSNIATEGRTLPSLQQLDEAVRAFMADHPHDKVTVVVDATFGHRIDASERDAFDAAVANGELVTPPAGAIGRGDAFVLQIADRAGATVLSNDSFQEFHGSYTWLFDEGRLVGGKPVPEVGWIFVLRNPVRGPASRRSVQAAKRAPGARPAKVAETRAKAAETPAKEEPARARRAKKAAAAAPAPVAATPARATTRKRQTREKRAPLPEAPPRPNARTRRRRGRDAVEPVNEPGVFIDFVAAHPVGSNVSGVVDRFTSHGANVVVGNARCYLSLKAMGDPPPRSAREVLTLGETRSFVVQAIDTPRRGIDLALARERFNKTDSGKNVAKAAARAAGEPTQQANAEEALVALAKKAPAKKAAAKKAPAKKAVAKKAPARKAPARKAPAKKAAARKAPARKAPARKAPARKAPAKKAAAKRAPARKAPAKKAAARKAPARKAPARKAPAKKAVAKKAPARKATR